MRADERDENLLRDWSNGSASLCHFLSVQTAARRRTAFAWLTSVLGVLLLFSAPGLLGPGPGYAHAPQQVSLESFNFPGRYIRHRNSLGYVEKLQDKLARKDATFRIVPGLAGKCKSFESVNYPNHFLRHENHRLKLARRSNEKLFLEDATFCFVTGLAHSTYYSFESVNLPGYFIRHKNFELWLERNDGGRSFKEDASFRTAAPGGGTKID